MSKKRKRKFGRGFTGSEKTVVGVGAFLILLGILSVVIAEMRLSEMRNASEIFTAEGKVTSCETKKEEITEDEVDDIDEYWKDYDWDPYIEYTYYYKAKVDVTVGGKVISGVYYSDELLNKGDIVSVSVMRKADGSCKVIDPMKYGYEQYVFWGVVSIIIGIGLILIAVLTRYMSNANARKLKKEYKQRQNEDRGGNAE